jgi:hypothetical protein
MPHTPLLDLDDEQILERIKKHYSEAEGYSGDWRREARDLYALVAGDQWDEEDRLRMIEQRRPVVTFNIAGKYIDAVSGLQVTNRQEVKYLGREPTDSGFGEYLTGIAEWARDQADAEDEESEAFMDVLIAGVGAIEMDIEMDDDPDGEIAIERRDPLEMYWDPRARKRNLRDRRWQMRVKQATEEEIIERWGEDAWDGITGSLGVEPEIMDNEIHHASEAWKYEHEPFGPQTQRTVPMVQYEEYESVAAVQVKTKFGTRKFTRPQWQKMQQVLDQNGVQYSARNTREKQYVRIFAAGNNILEADLSPYQDGFTINLLTGKRDRNKNMWYGVGRAIRDPQLWANKLFSTILHAMASGAKGGLLAEEDAFEDPSRAEDQWASPDSITWMQPGALQAGKVQEKKPASYPAGLDRLMEFAVNALPETSGLNLEIMGMANRQQPGIVEAQRKQSAMTVIAWAFDSMRRYYKDHGRQLAYYVREYIADGRLARINTKDGKKYIPILRDKLSIKFDVVVDEAPTSINVKERVWLMLEGLLPHLLKMGMPVPAEVLDYSPLPEDLQNAWKKLMQEPSPEQQQEKQLDTQERTAEIDKDKSIAELNRAKVRETAAKTGKTVAGA